MRRLTNLFALTLAVMISMAGCKKDDPGIKVTDIVLNKSELSLKEGDSEALVATIEPDDATNKTVIWATSEPAVATVDEEGVVDALAPGTAVITVTTEDGEKRATCEVTVKADVPEFDEVKATISPDRTLIFSSRLITTGKVELEEIGFLLSSNSGIPEPLLTDVGNKVGKITTEFPDRTGIFSVTGPPVLPPGTYYIIAYVIDKNNEATYSEVLTYTVR